MPIYLLASCYPPKCVMKRIESMFSHFLWGLKERMVRRIWVRLAEVACPTAEGGLEVWRLQEITEAMAMNMWWKFRSQEALWIAYFHTKYCRRVHPSQEVATSAASFVWLRLLAGRALGEDYRGGQRQGRDHLIQGTVAATRKDSAEASIDECGLSPHARFMA